MLTRHPSSIAFDAAALALGLLAGWLDLAHGELFVTALLLLAAGMAFGLFRPARGWAAGIALGFGVTAAHLVAHLTQARPHPGGILATLLALIPAVVGGAVGGLMRITWRNLRGTD